MIEVVYRIQTKKKKEEKKIMKHKLELIKPANKLIREQCVTK